ncbi:MAG: hypothetical protein AB7V13_10645 [Pseudorhodoplanes sp.]|uniref:hypothetical protein n=1 Tax=Pseudorhodoplanes sp. TaxID=1934341 RepID=UPI003D13D47F
MGGGRQSPVVGDCGLFITLFLLLSIRKEDCGFRVEQNGGFMEECVVLILAGIVLYMAVSLFVELCLRLDKGVIHEQDETAPQ